MSLVAPTSYWDRRELDYYITKDSVNDLLGMSNEDIDKRLGMVYKVMRHHESGLKGGHTGLLGGVIRDESTLNSIEEYRKLLFNLKSTPTEKFEYTPMTSMGTTDWNKTRGTLKYNSDDLQNSIDLAFQRGVETENKGGDYKESDYSDERITLMKDLLKILEDDDKV